MSNKFKVASEMRPVTVQSGKDVMAAVFWEEVSSHRLDIVFNSTLTASDLYQIRGMIESAYHWGCRETKNQMQDDLKKLIGLPPYDR